MAGEGEGDGLELFQLRRVASADNICLSVFSTAAVPYQIVALVIESGDILFYHYSSAAVQASVRCVPWFDDPQKRIRSAAFDQTTGSWLLVACHDSSLYVVPTQLVAVEDPDWSPDDITALPPLCGLKLYDFYPSAVAWWDRTVAEGRYQRIGIIGGRRGEIIFVNLHTGCVVGHTCVEGSVNRIQVCKDDSLIDSPPVFLIITNENHIQWKLVLEDQDTGYSWPLLSEHSRAGSSASLISGVGSEEAATRPALTSFPLARARLQGLKQLSVEKLATLRQKLTESRNRGLGNAMLKRRGSSSSEESLSRRRSSISSDSESLSTSNCVPKMDVLSDTSLYLQTSPDRPIILGHHNPSRLLTIYNVDLNMSAISIHRLHGACSLIYFTDWLILVSDMDRKLLSAISSSLSQCCLDTEKQILTNEFNPDSMLQQFKFDDGEEIQVLCKLTPTSKDIFGKYEKHDHEGSHWKRHSHRSKSGGFIDQSLEQCALVTNKALYKIVMRKSPREVVFASLLSDQDMERAEQLCCIFGLELQPVLERAAERQLAAGNLDHATSLYKLSRCRPVKSVLHMASAGFTSHLLTLTTSLLHASQFSQTESLHMSNLSVLTFTEQCLRNNGQHVFSQFRKFLRDNHHYDEVLAVSVVGQSGLCELLEYLCEQRGLASQTLEVLARVINCQHTPVLNCELCEGFWECMSNNNLCQPLVTNPDIAKIHICFVQSRLSSFSQILLQRFANLYDPSQPNVRPILKKLMNDTNNVEKAEVQAEFPLSEWLACYLLVCLYLSNKAADLPYSPDLMVGTPLLPPSISQHPEPKDVVNVCPSVVSAGYTHVGLVRNNQLYTWGYTANGCLGVGPSLAHTLQPGSVPLFPTLGIRVISVSCGKLHSLALTSNGVYAWGSSAYGQLGIGVKGQSGEPRLVQRLYEESVVSVEAGQYHSLAITAAGRVFSWGWGVHGQLGHGDVEDRCYPTPITSLSSETIVACSGGHAHSLMLTATGRVWACGSSVFGQLGTGSNLKSNRPVQVFGLAEKIISISTGYFHNLALASSNRLYAWGSSPQVLRLQAQAQKKARLYQQQAARAVEEPAPEPDFAPAESSDSQEGNADTSKSKPHFKLAPTSRFVTLNSELVVSPSTEFKGLLTGRVAPEASNTASNEAANASPPGMLLAVDDGLSHLSPTLVDTSHVDGRITEIHCGCHHSALLTDTGQMYTWGRNLDAQLGNGARTKEALYPTQINIGNGASKIMTVACGGDFTIAIDATGKVWGWGSNQVGQLGREPLEDATKAGLEGRLLMLKTSKRVIKLPHGSLNTVETPKEIPSLPCVQIEFQTNVPHTNIIKTLPFLSHLESPAHGWKTLHFALSYFHGYYDATKFREKCVELEDYQTASKIAFLDKQFDIAMSYQLHAAVTKRKNHKAASGASANKHWMLRQASLSVTSTEEFVPTLEASLTVSTPAARKIGINRAKANVTEPECVEFDCTETLKNGENPKDKVSEDAEEKSASEIHAFAVQGGAEEMSTRSQDTLSARSGAMESRCETPDTLASSGCDDCVTKSEIFDSPTRKCVKSNNCGANKSLDYENIVNKHIKELEQLSDSKMDMNYVNSPLIEDLVHIVEFYIDMCEQSPQTSLKALLKQGLEFWIDHKLPVCRLEAILLSHWSLVSYPLGLLLLGNSSEVQVDTDQVLGTLSTDFSLQLCSAMVNQVQDKESSSSSLGEVMSLLSELGRPAGAGPEQLSLDTLLSHHCSQAYMDFDFIASENELLSNGVVCFSCDHKYDGTTSLQQAVAGAARCLDDRSLPHTATVLRDLYQQSLGLACPNCVLNNVTQELG